MLRRLLAICLLVVFLAVFLAPHGLATAQTTPTPCATLLGTIEGLVIVSQNHLANGSIDSAQETLAQADAVLTQFRAECLDPRPATEAPASEATSEATPDSADLLLPVPADIQHFATVTQQAGYVGVTQQGFYTLGNPTAPVTLEEIGSFSCPACQAFFRNVLKNLEPYLAQGKLRYVFIPVNNYGKFEATSLTRTALCAGQQGQFWQMHNALYEWLDSASGEIESATFPRRAAHALGLDQARFSVCLQTPNITATVKLAEAEATRRGIQGTPSLYINGRLFTDGAPTLESVRNRIELALQGQ